jgi:hypothetical protein
MKLVPKLLNAALAVAFVIPSVSLVHAQAAPKNQDTKTAPKAAAKAAAPTAQEIADAKAKGLVWVNTGSGVYQKGGRSYGKTKQGQFMTEADAQKAGYHEAKRGATKKGGAKASAKNSGSVSK